MYIPTYEDMLAAHQRIKPHIRRTPVRTSAYLDDLAGCRLFFKCENFQEPGAFKVRGACNAVFGLDESQAIKGVATHSSGNHASCLSYAAMLRALQRLQPARPLAMVLVDGVLPLRLWDGPQRTVVRGDSQHLEIAAASVLAKQARDALITRLAARYPAYGLERHAGYGTAVHRQALLEHGPTPLHRRSFLRKVLPA